MLLFHFRGKESNIHSILKTEKVVLFWKIDTLLSIPNNPQETLTMIINLNPTLICFLFIGMGSVLQAQSLPVDQPGLSDTINLHPVTIIALRPTSFQIEKLDLNYMDYMAHDAGALLKADSCAIEGFTVKTTRSSNKCSL